MKRRVLSQDELLYGAFYHHNENRSKKAQEVDNAMNHSITSDVHLWFGDPSRKDIAGIDTVMRKKPSGYTKQKGHAALKLFRELYGYP